MCIYLGKFHHDLTVLPNPGIMVNKGNHPQMAELFRLVNYYNLPRYICIYICIYYYPTVATYDKMTFIRATVLKLSGTSLHAPG